MADSYALTPTQPSAARRGLRPGLLLVIGLGGLGLLTLALAWGASRGAFLLLGGLLGLGLLACLLFRPYWYLCLVIPGVLSWSYTFFTSPGAAQTWMDVWSPWRLRVGPMPVADILLLLVFLRVVVDPRFLRSRERYAFDPALAVFLLAYLPSALIGMLHRDAIQTWTLWLYSIRAPILFAATYLAASRLIPAQDPGAAGRFLLAPLLGVTLAVLGNAYRAFGLHQLVSRAGSPLLVFSEANMLPTMVTVGIAYLATGRTRRSGQVLAWAGIAFALAMLLIGTRRSVIAFSAVACLLMLFYLPREQRRRAGQALLALVVAATLGTAVFTSLSGSAGRMWIRFMAQQGWTQEGQGYRTQEIANVVANLNKYGGWVLGLGAGRRWERLLPQENRFYRTGFGADAGHLWFYPTHVQFLRNLLEQGIYGVTLLLLGLVLVLKITAQRARQALQAGESAIPRRTLLVGTLAGFLVTFLYLFAYANVGIFAGALLAAMGSFARDHESNLGAAETA